MIADRECGLLRRGGRLRAMGVGSSARTLARPLCLDAGLYGVGRGGCRRGDRHRMARRVLARGRARVDIRTRGRHRHNRAVGISSAIWSTANLST